MTTITALETFATYTAVHQLDAGGSHLRTALLAAILTHQLGMDPAEAIDLVTYDAFDDRVRAAGFEADELIDRARRAAMTAEYGEEVPA
jgi:hypothetical protein